MRFYSPGWKSSAIVFRGENGDAPIRIRFLSFFLGMTETKKKKKKKKKKTSEVRKKLVQF